MFGRPIWPCLIVLLVGLSAWAGAQDTFSPEHLKRARALHAKYLVLDSHSDVTPKFENPSWNFAERHDTGHTDDAVGLPNPHQVEAGRIETLLGLPYCGLQLFLDL